MEAEVMKCAECGSADLKVTREDHHYTRSGLSNVWLRNMEARTCRACGARHIPIPRVTQLHRVLAEILVNQRSRLTSEQVRFLRKYLGLSGKDFAARMGVTASQVSRWESDSAEDRIGPVADRLLRLLVMREQPIESYPSERLAEVAEEEPSNVRLDLTARSSGWQAELHAA
jgi:putative zinc finger/helix-turn-helix YgiT family protein